METKFYETPVCEVVEIKADSALLQGSPLQTTATRSGYDTAVEETWE